MTTNDLTHVYWIGGSSCGGKSTVARELADRFGLRLYDCDAAFEIHEKMVSAEQFPVLHRLSRLSWNDLWMRPVGQQVSEEIEMYHEEWRLILKDLRRLPADRSIVAEGSALLPELFNGAGILPARTIWLVSTPDFQRQNYARRAWVSSILAKCGDPAQAWANWMDRDAGFAAHVAEQARARGRTVITTDGSEPVEQMVTRVMGHFGLD